MKKSKKFRNIKKFKKHRLHYMLYLYMSFFSTLKIFQNEKLTKSAKKYKNSIIKNIFM